MPDAQRSKALVSQRPPYLRARVVLLFVAWCLFLFAAITLHVLCDVFQRSLHHFPLVPTIFAAILLNGLCAFVSAYTGSQLLAGFRLYQPFVGGQSFVVIQAFGYGALSVAEGLVCMYVQHIVHTCGSTAQLGGSSPSSTPLESSCFRFGVLSILGLFPFAANAALMTSLLFFMEPLSSGSPAKAPPHSRKVQFALTHSENTFRRWSKPPLREMALVISFSIVTILFALLGSFVPSAAQVSRVIYLAFQLISGSIIHFVIGHGHTANYKLFMPMLHSWRATLTQFVTWLLYVCSLYWGVMELHDGSEDPTRLLALAFGGCGCTLAFLLFVRIGLAPHTCPDVGSRNLLTEYGLPTLTCASFLHAILIWAVSHATSLADSSVATNWDGARVAQTVAAMFLLGFPPATHLMGRLVVGEAYHVWQPFRGNMQFIVLQGLGWTSFGSALVAGAASFTSTNSHAIRLLAALAVFAQLVLHSSVVVFSPRAEEQDVEPLDDGTLRRGLVSAATRQVRHLFTAHGRPLSLISAVLSGELLLGLLLAIAAMILRVVCDVGVAQLKHHLAEATLIGSLTTTPALHPSTIHFIAFLTAWMMFAATPLAHSSGRDKGIAVFRPFGGSGLYIALQAVGWTLYSITLLASIVAFVTRKGLSTFDASSSDPLIALQTASASLIHLPPFWFTLEGVMASLPLALISISVAVETKHKWSRISDEDALWESEVKLRSIMRQHITDPDEFKEAEAILEKLTKPLRETSVPWSVRGVAHRSTRNRKPGDVERNAEDDRRRQLEDIKEQQGTATLIVCMMCVGSAVLFLLGAAWVERDPPEVSVGFAVSGLFLTTLSCFSVHYLYGSFVHGDDVYSFFMPFTGGTVFIALQAVGWAFYTASTVVVLHIWFQRGGTPLLFVVASVFAVSAQSLVLGSIPRFHVSREHHKTVLEKNAEALVAALLFIASFSYAQAHRFLFAAEELPFDSVEGEWQPKFSTVAVIPLVVAAVTSCFAIPLSISAVRGVLKVAKASEGHGSNRLRRNESASEFSQEHSGVFDQQPLRTENSPETIPFLQYVIVQRIVYFMGLLAALVLAVLPIVAVFALHYVGHFSVTGIVGTTIAWNVLTFGIGMLLCVIVGVQLLGKSYFHIYLRQLFWTCAIFSVPSLSFIVPMSPMLLFPDSLGSKIFAGHATVLMLLGDFAVVRFLCSVVEITCLGFSLSHHIATWCEHGVIVTLLDVALPVFMLWYHSRYVGRPERSGSLVSAEFATFGRRVFLEEIAAYFGLRVIVDRDLDGGAHCNKKRAWETGPVLFSYHPHGVFPGTTLLLPHTKAWQAAVRIPTDEARFPLQGIQKISVHAADIVFRVAFLRDIVLSLGGRVVSKAAIEGSLAEGNSVMIVTGGQSEMLWTKISDTEMHLVTHHHGFIRLAVKHQVPLVPVLCFAEHNVMDNVHIHWLQRKMLKLIGFPFPTVPHGRWYLPVPNRTPLSVVVGSPVNPPEGLHPEDSEGIAALSKTYFAEIQRIFYKHREECGYPKMELILHGK